MALREEIRTRAPSEYRAFVDSNEESISVGDYVLLYGAREIDERNATFEVQRYMPEWIAIGDDGGGSALLMRLDGADGVYRCGHGALSSMRPHLVATSFAAWLAAGCPLDDD